MRKWLEYKQKGEQQKGKKRVLTKGADTSTNSKTNEQRSNNTSNQTIHSATTATIIAHRASMFSASPSSLSSSPSPAALIGTAASPVGFAEMLRCRPPALHYLVGVYMRLLLLVIIYLILPVLLLKVNTIC